MKINKVEFFMLLFFLAPVFANAQQTQENFMYSSGRIYVVIAVLLIILIGLFLYLIRIDRRVKKMEDAEGKR